MAGYQGGNARSGVETGAVDSLGDFAFKTLMSLQERQTQAEKFNMERREMANRMAIANQELAQRQQEVEAQQAAQEAQAKKLRQDRLMKTAEIAGTPEEFVAMLSLSDEQYSPQEVEAGKFIAKSTTDRKKAEKADAMNTAVLSGLSSLYPGLVGFMTPEQREVAAKAFKSKDAMTLTGVMGEAFKVKDASEQQQALARSRAQGEVQRGNALYSSTLPRRPPSPQEVAPLSDTGTDLVEAGNDPGLVERASKGLPGVFTDDISEMNVVRRGGDSTMKETRSIRKQMEAIQHLEAVMNVAASQGQGGLWGKVSAEYQKKLGTMKSEKAAMVSALDAVGLGYVAAISGAAFTDQQAKWIMGILPTIQEATTSGLREGGAAWGRFRYLEKTLQDNYLVGVPTRLQKDDAPGGNRRAILKQWGSDGRARRLQEYGELLGGGQQQEPDPWE